MMCNPTKNVRLFHISSECLSPRPTFSKSRSFNFKSNNSTSHHHHNDHDHDDNCSINSSSTNSNSFKIKPLMKGILLHPAQLFHTSSSSSSSDDNNNRHHKHGSSSPKVWTHGKEQRPSVTKSVLRRGRFSYGGEGNSGQQQQVQVPPEHKNSTSTIDTLDESTESSIADDLSFVPPVRLSFSTDDTEHEEEPCTNTTTTISLPTDHIKLADTIKTEFARVLPPAPSSERPVLPILLSVEQEQDSSTLILTDQKKKQVEKVAAVVENGNTTTSSSVANTSSTTIAASPLDSQISESSQVSFGSVEIYTFERMVGDNPSVSRGPPITISYRHIGEKRELSIDDYERKRRNKRLTKDEMKLDPMDRLVLLKASGATLEEINHAKELARDERLKRIESAKAYFKKQADASNGGKKKFSLSINDMTDTMNGLWKKVQISSHLIQGQT